MFSFKAINNNLKHDIWGNYQMARDAWNRNRIRISGSKIPGPGPRDCHQSGGDHQSAPVL